MRIVLDTNVLVSAMLKPMSKPGLILDAVLGGKLILVVNQAIFDEYSEVLSRPRLKIPAEKADAILRFIAFSAQWVDRQPILIHDAKIEDPGDLPFAEAALCSGAEVIVTGNLKHFAFLQNTRISVLLPDEFLQRYSQVV